MTTCEPAAAGAEPLLHRLPVRGHTLACFEWRPERRGQGPSLFLVHATGFHGRVWDQVIARLPADWHVLSLEQRGHGRSDAVRFAGWEDFGRDVGAAAQALGLEQALGVGHSMGGHALLQGAVFAPAAFARLVVIDPVVFAPAQYHPPEALADEAPAHPAAGRKNHFASPQAMFERFADRVPYALFDRRALHDYCAHGLKPAADGQGFQLACAPGFEARIYASARHNPGVYASIRALQIPVSVVRVRDADPGIKPYDMLGSPTWPGLAAELRQGRDLQLPGHTHLVPMQDPGLVAGLIREARAAMTG